MTTKIQNGLTMKISPAKLPSPFFNNSIIGLIIRKYIKYNRHKILAQCFLTRL